MSLLKKLAGETAIYGLSSIIGRVVSWVILTPYYTRTFSTTEYGIVNDLYFYTAFLLVIYTYRMETTFFRFSSRRDGESTPEQRAEQYQRTFTTATLSILGTTLVFTTLVLLLSDPIAAGMRYPGRAEYVMLFILIVGLDALAAIPFARLRMDARPLRFAYIRLGAIISQIVLVFFFLEACPALIKSGWIWVARIYDPTQRVTYVFWANLIASAGTLLWLAPLYLRVRWRFDPSLWRRMLGYALPLVLAGLAGIVNQLIGTTLLKYLGPGSVEENLSLGGIYSAVAKLAVLMNLFVQAFNYAAEPFFFRQAALSDDRTIYAQVARAFALVGSLAFLGIMLYLNIIQHFLGEEYREGLGILPLLLVANFFLGLYYTFAMSYKLTDQTRIGGYIALASTVITLGLNFWLIPIYTYYAPAWASLACYTFMALASYWMGQRIFPVPYRWDRMALYLFSAVAVYGLSLWLEPYTSIGLVYEVLVHTALLLGYLLFLAWLERAWLGKLIKRMKRKIV